MEEEEEEEVSNKNPLGFVEEFLMMVRGGYVTASHGELLLRHAMFALRGAHQFADARVPIPHDTLAKLRPKVERLGQQLQAFRTLRPTWVAPLHLMYRGDFGTYFAMAFIVESLLLTRVHRDTEWRRPPLSEVAPAHLQQLWTKAPDQKFMDLSADSVVRAFSVLSWKISAPKSEESRSARWLKEYETAVDLTYKRAMWLVAQKHEPRAIQKEWRLPLDPTQMEVPSGKEEKGNRVGVARTHTCEVSLKFVATVETYHSWLMREILEARELPCMLPVSDEERQSVQRGVENMARKTKSSYEQVEPYAVREPWQGWVARRRVNFCDYEIYKNNHSAQMMDEFEPRLVVQKRPEIVATHILNNDKWDFNRWCDEGDVNWVTDFLLFLATQDKTGYDFESLVVVDKWYDRQGFTSPLVVRLRARDSYLVFVDGDWSKCAMFPSVSHCVSWLILTENLPLVYTCPPDPDVSVSTADMVKLFGSV